MNTLADHIYFPYWYIGGEGLGNESTLEIQGKGVVKGKNPRVDL